MKTLIAVDDGPESKDAVGFAKNLLSDDDQVIVLNVASYHVAPAMAMGTFGAGVYVDPATPIGDWTDPDADEAAEGIVEEASRSLGEGSHAEARVEHGDVAAKICEVAAEESVELIVLGTHDRGTWSRLWFGSVSDRVVHDAPCPVLVVR